MSASNIQRAGGSAGGGIQSYSLSQVPGGSTTINGWEPPIVEKVRVSVEGNAEPQTNQCGQTEVKKNGDGNWTVAVNGIVLEDDLSFLQNIGRSQKATVNSTALGDQSGEYIVSDLSYEQKAGEVTFQEGGTSQAKLMFPFQIQFKEEKSPQ